MDSEGREAMSSSDSEYEFCLEGIMYADIENEGFDPAGEGEEDIEESSVIRSERKKERKPDQAVACLLPCQ